MLGVENRHDDVVSLDKRARLGIEWTVDGELTIGDVTAPITLAVEAGDVGDYFDGTRHVGIEAIGEIRRSDFGLGFGPLGAMLGDVVKIELDLEFIEPVSELRLRVAATGRPS